MINKQFNEIDKEYINYLIDNKIMEDKMLDYKAELPGPKDSDKKEFLADISSFANASGGYIIYGISEERDENGKSSGKPKSADGLKGINPDAEIRRMEDLIIHGLDPRVAGFRARAIDDFQNGPIILCHIPKSWISPHMVTLQTSSRFFTRKNGGKYPMDVSEIRSSILLSESLPEKMRRFRDDRISKIIAEETPVLLDPYPKTVMHIIPITNISQQTQIDLNLITKKKLILQPLGPYRGWNPRYNLDGFLTVNQFVEGTFASYLQLFRNGVIETVDTYMLKSSPDSKQIYITALEEELISALDRLLKAEQELGIQPPFSIMISLIWVKGYTLIGNSRGFGGRSVPIDRDLLLLPDILVDNYELHATDILRPAFDAIWQAAGYSRCFNYSEDGKR